MFGVYMISNPLEVLAKTSHEINFVLQSDQMWACFQLKSRIPHEFIKNNA
jgi:hypothetical protein